MTTPKYEFEVGDYIQFHRIVFAEQEARIVRNPHGAGTVLAPRIPEQVLLQGGSGQIVSIAKSPRKVVVGHDEERHPIKHTFRTARVAAGQALGTVTAILDDATLSAKQGGLFDMAAVDTDTHNMYGTDGRLS